MVRKYKRKGNYNNLDEDKMKKAINSVIETLLSVIEASEGFIVLFETLRRKVHLKRSWQE